MNRQPVLGLVGGMGSGKSLIAEEFTRHGARVISGDQLGHEALKQPVVKAKIIERWGESVLDEKGDVVRRKLAAIVFENPAELKALEALSFPWIERRIVEEIDAARQNREVPFVILDAAIMMETGWNKVCDWIVYVDTPRETRLTRLAHQRGWTPEQVEAREKAQMPLDEKKLRADSVIDNSGSREEVARQVEALLGRLNIVR